MKARLAVSLVLILSLLQAAKVKNIRFYASQQYSRVVVDLSGFARYRTGRIEDRNRIRFYIDIYPAVLKLSRKKRKIVVGKGDLISIRTAQFRRRTVRVVLDLKSLKSCKVFTLPNPFRIVIDVVGKGKAPTRSEREALSLARQLGLKVRRIVIDPGHGGKDPGAVSTVNGLREKDIVLDVARYLKQMLEKDGFEVFLTREDDRYLTLEERTAFANGKQADLFISIHVNSCRKPSTRGVSTYYLNFATDQEAERVAARENEASSRSFSALEDLIEKIILNDKINESKSLAKQVQKALVNTIGEKGVDNGVRGAPFFVLIGAEMPAILVELMYLSNPVDARKLRSRSFRMKLAKGLYQGLISYVKILEGEK